MSAALSGGASFGDNLRQTTRDVIRAEGQSHGAKG
jgi:hypothetical protein